MRLGWGLGVAYEKVAIVSIQTAGRVVVMLMLHWDVLN